MSERKMRKSPEKIFREHGGQMRMSEAVSRGITRYMLYSLRDKAILKPVVRGVYRLTDMPEISNPDLVTVSLRCPHAVLCLVSALSYHGITTQVPHEVSIAISRSSRVSSMKNPPVRIYKFSKDTFESGIEEHRIDGVIVRVYSPEKTLADCFKYRNKIGMDIVLEALKLYKVRKKVKLSKLLEYARICRVENVMRPYLEATF